MDSAPFEPTEDSHRILLALEVAGMKWIVDELREVIRRGKRVTRQERIYRNARSELVAGSRVVPLDPEDQLSLIVDTIRMYTSELYAMWEWSRLELVEDLQLASDGIVLLTESGQPDHTWFPNEFSSQIEALDSLLRQLVPSVPDEQ